MGGGKTPLLAQRELALLVACLLWLTLLVACLGSISGLPALFLKPLGDWSISPAPLWRVSLLSFFLR